MKKIVRLTENDLERIVRKVLEEQTAPPSQNPMNVIEKCFKDSGIDMQKYQKCMAAGAELMQGKIPQSSADCVKEITDDKTLGIKIFSLTACVSSKFLSSAKNPVMS
jgi:hypothetical protein